MWVLLAAGLNFSSFILRSLVRRRILFSKKAAYFDEGIISCRFKFQFL